MKKTVCLFLFTLLLLSASETGAEVKIPHEFKSGEVARASEVNANFTTLKKAIEQLETLLQKRIAELETQNKSLEKENRALKESIAELKTRIEALEKRLSSLAAISSEEPRRQKVEIPTEEAEGSKVWADPITGMEFVWIKGGCFQMGCVSGIDCNYDEKPVHEVCLDGFWMGKYEVTQAQWHQVMKEYPSYFDNTRIGQDTSNYPVEQVSWNEVQEFLQRLNEEAGQEIYRLPSEAEWEYACRAGTQTAYSFGNDAGTLDEYAWYEDNSGRKTHPVGQLKPNAWGLYDMHGNVWEWCADLYSSDAYRSPAHQQRNPVCMSGGPYRVNRGGSWGRTARYGRCAYRDSNWPGGRDNSLGFRLARKK